MEMMNCLKWVHEGQSYEACDFGSFVRVHVPEDSYGRADHLDVSTGASWTCEPQRTLTVVTLKCEGVGITLTASSFVARMLCLWFARVATG